MVMNWFETLKALLKLSPDGKTTAFVIIVSGLIWQNTTALVEAKHSQGIDAIRAQQASINRIVDLQAKQIEEISAMRPKIDSLDRSLKRIDDWVLELYRFTIPKNERKNRYE